MARRRRPVPGQLGLFEGSRPLPYVRPSATSRAAAVSMMAGAAGQRLRIYRHVLERGPEGATCDEIEVDLGMSHQSASARLYELVEESMLVDDGRRRKTRGARMARVLVLPTVEPVAPHGCTPARPAGLEWGCCLCGARETDTSDYRHDGERWGSWFYCRPCDFWTEYPEPDPEVTPP